MSYGDYVCKVLLSYGLLDHSLIQRSDTGCGIQNPEHSWGLSDVAIGIQWSYRWLCVAVIRDGSVGQVVGELIGTFVGWPDKKASVEVCTFYNKRHSVCDAQGIEGAQCLRTSKTPNRGNRCKSLLCSMVMGQRIKG